MLLKYCLSTGLDNYVDLILDKSTLSKHIQLLLNLSTATYKYLVMFMLSLHRYICFIALNIKQRLAARCTSINMGLT